jgi:hypothetical protein
MKVVLYKTILKLGDGYIVLHIIGFGERLLFGHDILPRGQTAIVKCSVWLERVFADLV